MSIRSKTPESSLVSWLEMLSEDRTQPADVSEEMRQAQSVFKSLVDSLPLNLLIKDASGRRVYANKNYLASHQKSLAEVIGKTDFDLFPDDLARKFTADDTQIVESGR